MSAKYTTRGRLLKKQLEMLENNVEKRLLSNEFTNNEFYLLSRKLETAKKALRDIRKNYESEVMKISRNVSDDNKRGMYNIIKNVKKIKIGEMDESLVRLKKNEDTTRSELTRQVAEFTNRVQSDMQNL